VLRDCDAADGAAGGVRVSSDSLHDAFCRRRCFRCSGGERERLARYRPLGFHLRDGLGPALDRKPTVWLLGERTRVVRDLLLDRQHLGGGPNAIGNVCRPQYERRVLGEDPVAEPLDFADIDDPFDEVAVDVIPAEGAVRARERFGDQARVAIDGRPQ
jgi:hypothetical protein